jgi:hypothetical protein
MKCGTAVRLLCVWLCDFLVQVFFIRDGMKFPDMVHALKPNPKNHIQEGWRIADFFSHHPEAMHMVRRGVWEDGGGSNTLMCTLVCNVSCVEGSGGTSIGPALTSSATVTQ